jgi:hypothetical protein
MVDPAKWSWVVIAVAEPAAAISTAPAITRRGVEARRRPRPPAAEETGRRRPREEERLPDPAMRPEPRTKDESLEEREPEPWSADEATIDWAREIPASSPAPDKLALPARNPGSSTWTSADMRPAPAIDDRARNHMEPTKDTEPRPERLTFASMSWATLADAEPAPARLALVGRERTAPAVAEPDPDSREAISSVWLKVATRLPPPDRPEATSIWPARPAEKEPEPATAIPAAMISWAWETRLPNPDRDATRVLSAPMNTSAVIPPVPEREAEASMRLLIPGESRRAPAIRSDAEISLRIFAAAAREPTPDKLADPCHDVATALTMSAASDPTPEREALAGVTLRREPEREPTPEREEEARSRATELAEKLPTPENAAVAA